MCLPSLVDSFQILFWIGMFSIACMTYKQATKSIFSSSRGEVFKVQLEELRKIIDFFNDFDNFRYSDKEIVKKMFLMSVLKTFIGSYKEIIDNESINSMEKRIEEIKENNEKYSYSYPARLLLTTNRDTSVAPFNVVYCELAGKINTRKEIQKFVKNLFIGERIKISLNEFINKEDEKEKFFFEYMSNKVIDYAELEKNPENYVNETFYDFYREFCEKFNIEENGTEAVLSVIRSELKINELIG